MCKKKPILREGAARSQYRREQHQLVIVDPDQISFLRSLDHLFSEGPVDVLVVFPPSRFVTQIIGQVMQQGPDAGIRKAFVKCSRFFLA